MRFKFRNRHRHSDGGSNSEEDDERAYEIKINKKIMIYEIIFFIGEILIHRIIQAINIYREFDKAREKSSPLTTGRTILSVTNIILTITTILMFVIRFFCFFKSVRGLLKNFRIKSD